MMVPCLGWKYSMASWKITWLFQIGDIYIFIVGIFHCSCCFSGVVLRPGKIQRKKIKVRRVGSDDFLKVGSCQL